MLIPIGEVVVSDARIRKNLGDIESLAKNISKLGQIVPIVVNKDYKLLAGERRLRACQSLGWEKIEAVVKDTADAENELEIEIAENEKRKSFTREEVINAGIELERIERIKAEERKGSRTDLVENLPPGSKNENNNSNLVENSPPGSEDGIVYEGPLTFDFLDDLLNEPKKDDEKEREVDPVENLPQGSGKENFQDNIDECSNLVLNLTPGSEKQNFGKTRNIIGEKLGMSGSQYRREKEIVQNKELFSPGMYDDWNNRAISTNKLYTELKKLLSSEEPKKKEAKSKEIVKETVKEVIKEVGPADYESLKQEKMFLLDELERIKKRLEERHDLKEYDELKKMNERLTDATNTMSKRLQLRTDQIRELQNKVKYGPSGKKSMAEIESEVITEEQYDRETERADQAEKEMEYYHNKTRELQAELAKLKRENEKNKVELADLRSKVRNNLEDRDTAYGFYSDVKSFQNDVVIPFLNSDTIKSSYSDIVGNRLIETCNSTIDYFQQILKNLKTEDANIIDIESYKEKKA